MIQKRHTAALQLDRILAATPTICLSGPMTSLQATSITILPIKDGMVMHSIGLIRALNSSQTVLALHYQPITSIPIA